MSKPTFAWLPDLGASQSVKSTVTPTKFGDGYEQRTAPGLNFTPKVWSVTFSKAATEAMAILAFLEARGGLEAFDWTDPFGNTGTYVCREWSGAQQSFGVYVVSGSFEQVFEY